MKQSVNKEILFPNIEIELILNNEKYKDLGTVLGTSTMSIHRRMRGEVDWDLGEIKKLCAHFKKDAHYLFGIEISQ